MTLFTRPRLIRAARYAGYAAIALVALAVAAALVLPAFLDTQRVGAELQAKLSQAVSFFNLPPHPTLFPRFGVEES